MIKAEGCPQGWQCLKLVKCMHKMMSLKKIKVFFKFIICTSNNRVELEQASKKHSRENEKDFKGERKFHTVNNHYV